MNDLASIIQLVSKIGPVGVGALALILFYRLADKYAAPFLQAQQAQATAMGQQATSMASLATIVREGQGDSRETLIAVRVLADRMNRHGEYLEAIERMIGAQK